MRYYFHVKDGHTILDDVGTDLLDLDAVKTEALRCSEELLKGMDHGKHFWTGEPWNLMVTDRPDGGGTTFLKMEFKALVR